MSPEHDIEMLLKSQPLRRPSTRLDQRMAHLLITPAPAAAPELTAPIKLSAWRVGRMLVPLALAAALVIAGVLATNAIMNPTIAPTAPTVATTDQPKTPEPTATPQPTQIAAAADEPVEIDEVWSELVPTQLVEVDGQAIQAYERQTVQRTTWVDEKNNVVIELTVPVTDVVLATIRAD
jgi:hypothetical protein